MKPKRNAMSKPIHDTFGPYKVTKRIGKGGQGEVWRAEGSDKQKVALKLIQLGNAVDYAKDIRKRVDREAKALKSGKHHGVVGFIDSGEENNHIWIAYELIAGSNVEDVLSSSGGISFEDLNNFITKMAESLDYIHGAKIYHRDLKPSNIMLRSRGTWSSPVIVDFGYSMQTNVSLSRLTVSGYAVGTRGFMAPELADTKSFSPLSDQFAFARIVIEVFITALDKDPKDYNSDHEEMLRELEEHQNSHQILQQACNKDPKKRFECVTDFANALSEAISDDGLLESVDEVSPVTIQLDQNQELGKKEKLINYFERLSCEVKDKRHAGGALWIIGDTAIMKTIIDHLSELDIDIGFASKGGRASNHRPAWYTKSPR
jgi:serine/threonine protein kinase